MALCTRFANTSCSSAASARTGDCHRGLDVCCIRIPFPRVDPAQVLVLLVGQREVLQHHLPGDGVEVGDARRLVRLRAFAGVGQCQQLLAQAAAVRDLDDHRAQGFAQALGLLLAQRDAGLGQHDGQRCAQLMRGIGEELRLSLQQLRGSRPGAG